MMAGRFVWLVFALGYPTVAAAQDTLEVALAEVMVAATRATETAPDAARSVYILNRESPEIEPGLSLQRALRGLPGIQIQDRGHYALGERVLVRGMGYRAAFGVRGVQAFLNGIPLTMPDGQTILDMVDPVTIRRAELLRGPGSLYWGNASGGILWLSTGADSSGVHLRYSGGSYGLQHGLASATYRRGTDYFRAYGSRVAQDGFRQHSDGSFVRSGAELRMGLGRAAVLTVMLNAAWQDVRSPGSLTRLQVESDPRQADPRYVSLGAGKASSHWQTGASVTTATRLGTLTVAAYGIRRLLDNPLTFAWIDLDRTAGGTYAQLRRGAGRFTWSAGVEIRNQRDDRMRFNNDGGVRGSTVLQDQHETVSSYAASLVSRLRLRPGVGVSAGVRMDHVWFTMEDLHEDGNDHSGSREFNALSPSLGVYVRRGSLTAYANVSTAFETPTTTELVNDPMVIGGFNQDLDPQRTLGLEIGLRTSALDVAVYSLAIRDRLVPAQSRLGSTYYSNAGRNRHRGVEIAYSRAIMNRLEASLAYHYTHFRFLTEPSGLLHVPGAPAHQLHVGVHLTGPRGWRAEVSADASSRYWADNANTAENAGHAAVDVYMAQTALYVSGLRLQPFARVQNLFNARYNGSVVVNAFGGRYFEPAPARALQIGLNLHW